MPASQRCFTRDNLDGGISSLGEFIFNNSETVIYSLATFQQLDKRSD